MTDFPSKTPASSTRIVVAKSGTSGNGKAGTVEGGPARPSRRSDRFPLPSRPDRSRRLFAVSAALLMVLVVFAVTPRDVRAGTAQPLAQSLASQSVTYGPGWERIVNPDGTVEMHQLPTFQRWDGVWRPVSSLNRSTGDWPYQLTDTQPRFSVTRLGATFVQAKDPGATYEFRPEAVKETIAIPMAPPTSVISVALTTTALNVNIANNTILLSLPGGPTMWIANDFHAWDSSTSSTSPQMC